MNPSGIRFRVARDPSRAFGVIGLIDQVDEGGIRSVATVTFDPVAPGRSVGDRLFELPDEACQALADQLWELGFRPRAAAGSAGQLDAVQAHLEDMRQIARGFLDGKTRLEGGQP